MTVNLSVKLNEFLAKDDKTVQKTVGKSGFLASVSRFFTKINCFAKEGKKEVQAQKTERVALRAELKTLATDLQKLKSDINGAKIQVTVLSKNNTLANAAALATANGELALAKTNWAETKQKVESLEKKLQGTILGKDKSFKDVKNTTSDIEAEIATIS